MNKFMREQIYASIFGAMVARQVMDHMSSGRGAPNDSDMVRFVDEADSVSLMALTACRELLLNNYTEIKGMGVPGQRDPDFPCEDFKPGSLPAGNCNGDGHYLCDICVEKNC